ncbi:beta-lactamase class C-like protein [Clostridium pasteurianum DSM 525 = ATCC 6013]|uniref:Beta-lactamase n=1 Tax=Clostridium pasteurianum DSM 525 = ATCC 6013 TaxID=1262449 RepID=A0A0H3J0R5_CLOPA|nr:serine hydrolase [Clostridium pasteurianum]AJA46934.1 beta-lactamase class C-like protein [Clostridium pasteurianum DSM 525 = ATCC 6013]AJA50922.1 beta-lactamase class C-like protein [Clostridium pasteurianum DSM 525 = ATCC 6013]AOZ74316.1 6-aminohexanoate hydrolase [Clostridium pasteurianum DSM 525 = ATCC 6013]AOZ78114.1 6-aminohexanoate hydrolase [Clostridium pasteurianum]ELP58183.1 beta-lactamase class C-like protein [Clostridium pasteurianum DSM 525 = ATCC 6013]
MIKKEYFHDDLERVVSKKYKNIAGIAVVKDGNTVYENYFNGYGKEDTLHVASVTKSILSALIGIAIDKGFIESVNQKVLDFFPEYDSMLADSKKQEVRIKHLLTMTAPYIYKREPFKELCSSSDWAKYALDLLGGKDECGTFKYSTAGAHLLSVILTKATGKTAREFANEYLFEPIGMKQLPNYEMTTETYMNFIKGKYVCGWVSDPKGNSTGGWGVTLSAVDMARFGQLYLNYGNWNGKQIISREWIEESLRDNSNHYGYLWWLFKEDEFAYCAMGDGGNVICCLPERNMVVAIASKFMMRPKDRMKLVKDYILPLLDREKSI